MKTFPSRKRGGFTLLEIMLVVAIIALLLGTGLHFMKGTIGLGRDARLSADFATFDQQLKTYEAFNGSYPTTEQGLKALVTIPETDPKPQKWTQLMEKLPKDPWNNDYYYECPGKHNPEGYDLYSAGPDRIPNTADDRGNWDSR